jgi:hypothetical protein
MGVPQLMMILEPNIVWDHTHAFNSVVGKEVEAQYCPGTSVNSFQYFASRWKQGGML